MRGSVTNRYASNPSRYKDCEFPWKITVTGISIKVEDLRWEQFVGGHFVIYFSDRTNAVYRPADLMRRTNPNARSFGKYVDDISGGMPPGPKPMTTKTKSGLYWATCASATGRKKKADLHCGTYHFDDTPGFEYNVGDRMRRGGSQRTIEGIEWSVWFQHKLWCSGKSKPFFEIEFKLTGGRGKAGSRPIPQRKIINKSFSKNPTMVR